jgi:hypothetical protein
MAFWVYGLLVLDHIGLVAVVAGLVIVQCAKAWCLDRMVLLFEQLKSLRSDYAGWEY